MILQALLAFILALFLLSAIYLAKLRIQQNNRLLPPGPPSSFFFGNLSSVPSTFSYRYFESLTQTYGPVFTLTQGVTGQINVVIGRVQAAIDILEKQGGSTVDRPSNISAGDTLSGGMRMIFTRSGDRFRKMRRALHAHMQQRVAINYVPLQQRNAKIFILDVLDDPAHHQEHAKRYAAAVVIALTYGTTINSFADPLVQRILACLERLLISLNPGFWKVELYPWLRYVPGYLSELKEDHENELALFKGEMDGIRQRIATNSAPPSFGKYLIEQQRDLDLNDDEIAYLAGSVYGAGSSTSSGAISVVVLAAITHPEAQKRVQQELDVIVGKDRAPTVSDETMLPQLMAFVLESFRWRPVAPAGFDHCVTKEIHYKNYVIPVGATVTGNIWSIGRDPEVFPDPETFNPQRWLTPEGTLRTDLRTFVFGFGRRICPGQHLAFRSVLLNSMLLHWAFDMSPDGPVDVWAFTPVTVTEPCPFKVKFEPRMDRQVIRERFEGYELVV